MPGIGSSACFPVCKARLGNTKRYKIWNILSTVPYKGVFRNQVGGGGQKLTRNFFCLPSRLQNCQCGSSDLSSVPEPPKESGSKVAPVVLASCKYVLVQYMYTSSGHHKREANTLQVIYGYNALITE